MFKRMLSFAILLGLAGGINAAIVLSTETDLPVHAGRDAYVPCAAFAKDNYVVAWQSGRIGPGSLRENFNYIGDIVGCCVGKTGAVLSAEPFVICGAADLQERPRAAAVNDTVLVVWHDLRNGMDWDVYGARVLADGGVLDPDGFLISGGAHNQAKPGIAWDGKTFVVVWQDFRNGKKYLTYAARVTSGGQLLDPNGILLSDTAARNGENGNVDPSVASFGDGRNFIFWSGGSQSVGGTGIMSLGLFLNNGIPGPYFYSVNSSGGGKLGPGFGNSSYSSAGPGAFLMAWRTEMPIGRGNGATNMNAYIFDSQGKTVDTLTLNGSTHRIMSADIVWDGTAFVAAWMEMRDKTSQATVDYPSGNASERILVSRISTTGVLVDAMKEVAGTFAAPAMNAAAASDGAGTTLITYEKQPATADVPIKIGFRMLTAQ